jgi:adenylate cyclase
MVWKTATLALGLTLAALFAVSPALLRQWQERLFDQMLMAPATDGLVVVDIGAEDDAGQPWDRLATARLVRVLAEARPQVIGFDMLFAGDCESAGALALAQALHGTPAILGFLLADNGTADLPPSHLALASDVPLWPAKGADAPCPTFVQGDLAAMVLLGDTDALVRRVPVGVAVAGHPYPGLAVAVAAKSTGGLALAGRGWLRLGQSQPLPTEQGQVRVPLSAPASWEQRTVAARDLLAGTTKLPDGAVILVGSSLPQRGGLRPTAVSPLTPSVQIVADAVTVLRAGAVPVRPVWAAGIEAAFVALTTLAALALLTRIAPARATLVMGSAAIAWALAAVLTLRLAGLLIDPALPPAAVASILLLAVTGRAAQSARAERVLRDRMGQILPATLVARLAAQPHLMRLEGEAREVTAVFTDIEGFSKATSDMGAREMVALLDAYFTLTCQIVLRHGGMVDKLVGDSIHALFNAPLDQPGHEAAALACAQEIVTATETFRAAHGGFGRTRIGLECGPAVLGDVGFGTRIDYTAHGPAVNLAARLQEANKLFGTQICIGPALASRLPGVQPLAEANLRGFGQVQLYTVRA